MEVAILGVGATGAHAARQLVQAPIERLRLHDLNPRRQRQVVSAVTAIAPDGVEVVAGEPSADDPPDLVVLATPVGQHARPAAAWIQRGADVVSLSDGPDEVAALLELDAVSRTLGRVVAVGAGFVPGLSCVLVSYAAASLDLVEVIGVYKAATAGPSCARQHHRALKSSGHDWLDGEWIVRRGGSGRELAWFPDPFGARDCYRGALPSPFLLQPVFPDAHRISARMAATRRDRFTSWLPMLRPPHADGGPGALRVEVRGRLGVAVETRILGVIDHPSAAGGAMAAVAAEEILAGRVEAGARGLASWPDPNRLLRALWPRGVRVAAFDGTLSVP